MEPLFLASSIISITRRFLSFTQQAILTAREPSKLYDIALSWRPLGNQQNFFLQIFDVPFCTGRPARPIRLVTNIKHTDHDIDDSIRAIPAQEERNLRVYFTENFDFQKLLPVAIFPLTESAPITSQWSLFPEQIHWEIDSYNLSLEPMLRGYFEDSYIDSVSIAAGTVRRTMKCAFHSMDNGRLICKHILHP